MRQHGPHTLTEYGITTTFVDIFNEEEVKNAIKDNTKAIFIETLGNPHSDVVDIEKIAKIAHSHKIASLKLNLAAAWSLFLNT